MKVVDRYWKGNKIWGVTIRVSRYLDIKVLKKNWSEGQFGLFMTS